MNDEWNSIILKAVQKQADARAILIEEMCEKALVDPERRGILVVEHWPEFKVTAELTKDVPCGEIHIKHKVN